MIYRVITSRAFAAACLLNLGGCGMLDWANTHMPVIGERCENWQCFTEGGREQSRLAQQAEGLAVSTPGDASAIRKPANQEGPGSLLANKVVAAPATPAAPPPTPLAPPAGEEGAYKYVPRASLAAGTSPFDAQQQ